MENNSSNICTACGSVAPNPNCQYCKDKSFTHRVIQIDNPENLVLFHKVVIPASLGDETTNPPYPGKYCNVLMVYEANGHSYLYSSDGIPTALGFDSGGILVVDEFPELDQAAINSLYIKRDTGDAKITTDGENWLIINEPGGKVLLVKEFPPVAEARAQTLYILSDNGEARILDVDGTWLPLNTGGGGSGTVYFNNIMNRPKIDGVEMTSDTDIPLSQITSDINSLSSNLSSKLNKYVVTDLNAGTNPSTTELELRASRENLWTEARETKTIPLPVASETQAGIMNTATFNAVQENKNNIEAIMGGAVAINGLPDPATQQEITDAWKNATGQDELINRASVYDVTNNKVWTYYANDNTWHPASNSAQVNINTFTNTSEGTILGSTNVGQVFAEPDGTGSVNGWDALSAQVSDNKDAIEDIQTAVDGKQDKLNAGNAIIIDDHLNSISAMVYPEDFFIEGEFVSGYGTVVELPKSAQLKPKKIWVYGNTEQEELTGSNLLYWPYNGTREGTLMSQRADTIVFYAGVLTGQGGKFYLYRRDQDSYDMPELSGEYNVTTFASITGRAPKMVIVDANGEHSITLTNTSRDNKITISTPAKPQSIYLELPSGVSGVSNWNVKPAIIPSSEYSEDEYYTGNTPSPSPDYPQPVMVVSGQQIISATGVNLYNYEDTVDVTPPTTADANGYITFTGDNTGVQNMFKNYYTHDLPLLEDTNYAIVLEVLNISGTGTLTVVSNSALPTAYGQFANAVSYNFSDLQAGDIKVAVSRTKSTFVTAGVGLRTFARFLPGQSGSITARISVVADTSITPYNFQYRKYEGQVYTVNLGANLFDKQNYNSLAAYFQVNSPITSAPLNDSVTIYLPCWPMNPYFIQKQNISGLLERTISTTEELPNIGTMVSPFGTRSTEDTEIISPPHAKYIVIGYKAESGTSIATILPNILDTLLVKIGSSVNDYAPYTTPVKLRKIGDKQDRIYRENLQWKQHTETDEISYDGSETGWTVNTTNHTASIAKPSTWDEADYYCSHFRKGDAATTNNTFKIESGVITFKANEIITSLSAWQDWLSENHPVVCGQLTNSTDEFITDPILLAELTKMLNIVPYPDYTLYATSPVGDARAILEIEAYKNSLAGITSAIRNIPICC